MRPRRPGSVGQKPVELRARAPEVSRGAGRVDEGDDVRRGSAPVRRGARHRRGLLGRPAARSAGRRAGRGPRLPARLRRRRVLRPADRPGARRGRAAGRDQVAGPVHRGHPRRDRRGCAGPRARAAVRAAPLGAGRGADRRARGLDHGLARVPGAVAPERGGARDARHVDASARARAGVQRPRRAARRHVGVDGRPAARARARRSGRRRPDGRPVRARRDPGVRRLRRRDASTPRASRARVARGARARGRDVGCSCSTTKWSSTTRWTPSWSRSRAASNSACSPTTDRWRATRELQGVPTCNLRRLAQELAPAIVPGDFVRVVAHARGQGRRARASAISRTARWSSSTAATISSAAPT